MMTPREFLTAVVRPNIVELDADDANVRKAVNAVNALDNLVGQMFVALGGKLKLGCTDTEFRECLATKSVDYRLVSDLALALKHGQLNRKTPVLTVAEVSSADLAIDEWYSLGDIRHMDGPHAIVETAAGDKRVVISVAEPALTFLEQEMFDRRV